MRKMIHKSMLAGALAVTLLCTPMQVQAAQTTEKTQTQEQENSATKETDAQDTQEAAGETDEQDTQEASGATDAQPEAAAAYTVRFEANKGTKVKTTLTLKRGDSYGTLPKTSREGYRFMGWYTKKQGGVKVTASSVFKGKSDQVLYAQWKSQMVTSITQPEQLSGAVGPLVSYKGSSAYHYKQNSYTGFLVLKNFKSKYLYCQYNYSRFVSGGRNVGCTATADAMLASIYRDKAFSPNDEGWIPGVGATWTNSVVLDGSKSYSVKQQCQAVYDYLNKGVPVMIRVVGHSVTAIGVREGVARSQLTPADLLIADPADGKVKCANEMGWRVMTGANGWGLRIPKDGGTSK